MNTLFPVLVDMSNAGETSVGCLLTDTFGVDLLEADDIVGNTLGAPIAELVTRNAPGLAEARGNAALRVLTSPGAMVTLGASQIEDGQTLRTLHDVEVQGMRVVELNVEASESARRQGLNTPHSPALDVPRMQLTVMVKTLRARYLDVAGSLV